MKIFWSWQSDLPGKISRHFIKESITEAIQELKQEAIFDDRAEIDHDTKDVLGSPAITDTILEKIKHATIFIADITPVAVIKDQKGKTTKKIMNPNVAIEMGFATAILGDNKIISIMNGSFGSLDDLPFDLKHKRGSIFYNLKDDSDKALLLSQKRVLVDKLKIALKGYANKNESNSNLSINLDINGKAIFFDPSKPLLKLSDDFSFGPKQKDYLFVKPSSYIYVKVSPRKNLNLSKLDLKKMMMGPTNNLTILPLFNYPSQGPEVNKYGAITTSFDPSGNQMITSFVQCFQDGSIVAIPGTHIANTRNALYLLEFKQKVQKFLVDAFLLLKSVSSDDLEIDVEIGLVNNDNINIVLPYLNNGNSYMNHHIGPLENESYSATKKLKVSDTERIEEVIKEFITSLMNDVGLSFGYDDHKWQ